MRSHVQCNQWLLAGLLVFGVSLGAPRWANAQTTKPEIKQVPARSIVSVEGKDTFAAYCAVCHGLDGKGNGPAVPALKVPVPDLTLTARRNAGKFDGVAVERVISGKDRVIPAHGTQEMPMWGPVFRSMRGEETVATLRMANLVKHLESIQQK
jgi:mono/diheme cytochrome c family protein